VWKDGIPRHMAASVLVLTRWLAAAAGVLRVRVMMCLALVAAERAVNLGVPIMYKNVVDTLSKASALLQLAQEHGSPLSLLLALAEQVGAGPGRDAAAARTAAAVMYTTVLHSWTGGTDVS
jgi:hypothetical protein